MFQTLLTGLVSLVDNFMVAALGDGKMAGVNVANQINFIYLVILNTTCIAGGIYLSQHKGAGDKEGMRQAFRFKLILALGISALYTVICLVFAEQLIGLMLGSNTEGGEIVKEGAKYLRAVAASFIPIGLSTAISTSFRDTGVTKVPLFVSVCAALVNTFFNWVLIYGNMGAPRLEVTGAAIATVFARVVEVTAFAAMVRKKKPDFAFKPQAFRRDTLQIRNDAVFRNRLGAFRNHNCGTLQWQGRSRDGGRHGRGMDHSEHNVSCFSGNSCCHECNSWVDPRCWKIG
jgi:Na+-driven multidrug efflux pump